ncbi:hypothetical protein [Flagellimonas sp.]|uniref:hypothetical protein n=1 Tax=Flagellimonas sp. TaxID=2058762 RepID=UPI0018659326
MPITMKTQMGHDKIYMSIDHLKSGTYQLNILLGNKVIKVLEIEKKDIKHTDL